jgi:hypothetical protein
MKIRSLILIASKRLCEPFYFKAGAKEGEQASYEYHSTLGHQEDVGFASQLRKMSERDDREQRATKNKAKAAEK